MKSYVSRKYLSIQGKKVYRDTSFCCGTCHMPLCKTDRWDTENGRLLTCLDEHLSSVDEDLGCSTTQQHQRGRAKGFQRRKHWTFIQGGVSGGEGSTIVVSNKWSNQASGQCHAEHSYLVWLTMDDCWLLQVQYSTSNWDTLRRAGADATTQLSSMQKQDQFLLVAAGAVLTRHPM